MRIFLAFLLVVVLFSCAYNKEELPEPISGGGVVANPVTYTNYAKQVIDNNCIACHSSTGGQLPHLTTFSQVNAEAQRIEARAINNSPTAMPPGSPLSQNVKDTLQLWINQGALQ